jgi:peptide/nickel transport system ATP-binding protein
LAAGSYIAFTLFIRPTFFREKNMNVTTLLNIQNLTVDFKTSQGKITAVDDISFSLKENEVLALLGKSGSGKTITALSIIQLLPAAAEISENSIIEFNHQNLRNYSEIQLQKIRGNQIGTIFQEPMTALNPVLTVGDQIAEVFYRHFKLSKNTARERSIEILREVGISNPENRFYDYPHQLSGGMRQRVVIAIAIAANPKLLIADEPTSALDVTTQIQILNLLKKLQAKYGMSILFVTHDLHVAKNIADRVVVMESGKITEQENIDSYFKAHSSQAFRKRSSHLFIPDEKSILDIKNFSVYFPIKKGILKRTVGYVKAVEDINLQLYSGKTLALVGESGSGKSTLAKGVLRLIPPTNGEVIFDEIDLTALSQKQLQPWRRDLQIIFQDPFSSLNPRMLVKEIIAEGLLAQKIIKTENEKEKRVDELLAQVGLSPEMKYRYPHEFSGGQRQRIGIARALAVQPKVIICDEPTSALDVDTQEQIISLLIDLQNKFHLAYLFITHNIPLAASIADEMAVMYQGKIIEKGLPNQIISQPRERYTKALIEAGVG